MATPAMHGFLLTPELLLLVIEKLDVYTFLSLYRTHVYFRSIMEANIQTLVPRVLYPWRALQSSVDAVEQTWLLETVFDIISEAENMKRRCKDMMIQGDTHVVRLNPRNIARKCDALRIVKYWIQDCWYGPPKELDSLKISEVDVELAEFDSD